MQVLPRQCCRVLVSIRPHLQPAQKVHFHSAAEWLIGHLVLWMVICCQTGLGLWSEQEVRDLASCHLVLASTFSTRMAGWHAEQCERVWPCLQPRLHLQLECMPPLLIAQLKLEMQ